MNAADFDRLEQTLGVRLPAEYRATMLAYPFPPDSDAAAFELPATVAAILALQFAPDEAQGPDGGPWPAHYVVIGSDGGEEVYVLDLSAAAPLPVPVLAYDLEVAGCRPLAPDVPTFVAWLRQREGELAAGEPAAGAAAAAAGHARRPWWRIRG